MTPTKSADIKRKLGRICAAKRIPVSGIFELTPRCNLRCKMCYVRLTPEEMAPIGRERTCDEWLSLAKDCKDMGLVFLLLTGGEPAIREDFCEIYENLATMGFSIAINTNGTILTPEMKELFHRLPPAQINITLYGTCRQDYEALCGDGNAFDKVSANLDWYLSEGILVHLNTTIAPDNYSKWKDLEEFALARELELRMTAYCFPPARRNNCASCSDKCASFSRITPEEAGRLIADDILYREGMDAVRTRLSNAELSMNKGCELDNGEPMSCLAGKSQFWVTWDGRITPCGMISTPEFLLFEHGFENAWKGLVDACDRIRLCAECTNCEYKKFCMNCAAVTFGETGDFSGKPEYMCSMIKAYRERLVEISENEE